MSATRMKWCDRCGHHGTHARVTPGSTTVEILLWLCLIVPGVIYSTWRLTGREVAACAVCGNRKLRDGDRPQAAAGYTDSSEVA